VSTHVNSDGWVTPSFGYSNLQDHSGPSRFVPADIDSVAWYNLAAADLGRATEEDDYEACVQRVAAEVRRRTSEFLRETVREKLWTEVVGGAVAGAIGGGSTGAGALAGFLGGAAGGVAFAFVDIGISYFFSKEFDVERLTLQECGRPPRRRSP